MIKVQNNIASRTPLPAFLRGLSAESLRDLSGTDPRLGVQDCIWLPEVDETPALGENQVYDGAETLSPDLERNVVVVVRGIRDLTLEEIQARWEAANPVPHEVPRYCGLLALKRHCIEEGALQELGAEESWEDGSLYSAVLAFRNALPAGAVRDKLDVALNDVLHWTLLSPTVADLCAVIGLSTTQRDALFRWAKAHEATL